MSGCRIIGGSLNTCPPLFSSDGRYLWVANSRVIFCIAVSSGSNGGGNCVAEEGGGDDNPNTKKKSHIHGGRGSLSDDTVENSYAETTITPHPQPLQKLHGHEADVSCLVWLDEKRGLLASSSLDGTVRVWVVAGGTKIPNGPSQHPRCARILRFESSVSFLHSMAHSPDEKGAKSAEICIIVAMQTVPRGAKRQRRSQQNLEERKDAAENKGNQEYESEVSGRLRDRRKLEAPREGEVGKMVQQHSVELRKHAIGERDGNPLPPPGSADTMNDDGIGTDGMDVGQSSRSKPPHRTCNVGNIQANRFGHNNHRWEILSVCLGKAAETDGGMEEEKNIELEKWSSVPLLRSVRVSRGSVPLCATFLHGSNEFLAVSRGCGLMVVSLATSPASCPPSHAWEPDLHSFGVPSGGKGRIVTAIAGSVTGAIATGHYDGTITIWHGMGAAAKQVLLPSRSSERSTTTPPSSLTTIVTTHWHAHAVSCLYFSPDGKFLLSGGEEGVLVQWNLVIGSKCFLSRLGGTLSHVRQAKDGVYAAVAVKDNSLKLIRLASWSVCSELRGLALAPPSDIEDFTEAIRLITNGINVEGSVDANNIIAINGLPGHIQFYDVALDALVENLEVTNYNRVSRTEELKSRPPVVRLVCFSPTGDKMATVDSRSRGTSATVWELIFWHRERDKGGRFAIDTLIRGPHDGPLVEALYHPYFDFVVTLSADGVYKTWELKRGKCQEEEAALATAGQWVASRSVRFKVGLKAFGAALSGDGSVLAVSHGRVVALWEPTAARLLGTLTVATTEPVRCLCFPSFRATLIGTGDGSLISWDLRSLRPSWYYESADVRCLAPVGIGVSQGTGLFVISISLGEGGGGGSAVLLLSSSKPDPLRVWVLPSDAPCSLACVKDGVLALMKGKQEILLLLWGKNEIGGSIVHAKEHNQLGVGLTPIGPGICRVEAVVPPLQLKLPKKNQHEESPRIGVKEDLIQFGLPPSLSYIAAESAFSANTLNLCDPSLLLEPYLIGQLGRGIGASSSSALSSAVSDTEVLKPNDKLKDSTASTPPVLWREKFKPSATAAPTSHTTTFSKDELMQVLIAASSSQSRE